MAPEAISEHLIFKNFLGEHPPRPPLVLHACLLIFAYIHIRHPRNPPSKNPGYGPDLFLHACWKQSQIVRMGSYSPGNMKCTLHNIIVNPAVTEGDPNASRKLVPQYGTKLICAEKVYRYNIL